MGRFNQNDKVSRKTTTYEGGTAYTKSLENEWTNMLFSYILQNKKDDFYRTGDEAESEFHRLTVEMIEKYGPEFVAKASVFTRNELGMRTMSEYVAAILNSYKFDSKRNFYAKYFRRPDGVGEVFAAIEALGEKRSHALVRGAADYLSKLDAYQIAKYNMRSHRFNMHDIINITHAWSPAINLYQKNELPAPETWEHETQMVDTAEDRADVFVKLVEEGKMGYLALIRNLNNILKSSRIDHDWVSKYLVTQIVDTEKIKKSKVFPYQIYVAYKACDDIPTSVIQALSEAFRISVGNMDPLTGDNLIVIDVSGSMETVYAKNSLLTIKEVSCVYATALFLMSEGTKFDIIKFGTDAKWSLHSRLVDPFTMINSLQDNEELGYGTDINTVWSMLSKKYDRIFLFSDMQVMERRTFYNDAGLKSYSEYTSKYGKGYLYSFDLGNYTNQIESDDSKIKYLTTVSDKVFEILKYLERGSSLVDVIKDYQY